jgi:tRNA(Arg) A34 adenosine deaminase TadA
MTLTPLTPSEVEHYMKLCIVLAHDALPAQEVPVSAMYVHLPTRTIISSSFNQTVVKKNAIRHCEVECLYQVQEKIKFVLAEMIKEFDLAQTNLENANFSPQTPLLSTPPSNILPVYTQINTADPIPSPLPSTTLTHLESVPVLSSYFHIIPSASTTTPIPTSLTTTRLELTRDSVDRLLHKPFEPFSRTLMAEILHKVASDIACIVSVEPCIMCTGVLTNSGVKYVYAGCGNDKFGGCGSIVNSHFNYSIFVDGDSTDKKEGIIDPAMVRSPYGFIYHQNNTNNDQMIPHSTLPPHSLTSIPHPTYTTHQPQSPWVFTVPSAEGLVNNALSSFEFKKQFLYEQGCLENEAIEALQTFYLRGNPNAPVEKRQRQLMGGDGDGDGDGEGEHEFRSVDSAAQITHDNMSCNESLESDTKRPRHL